MADDTEKSQRRKSRRKTSQSSYIISRNVKNELRQKMREVSEVLKKPIQERTAQDKNLVKKNPDLVKASQKNARRLQTKKERILEVEDEPELLLNKCRKLTDLIKSSKNVVVYTGAGISTAASIPDYRGPNGVWTLLKKGHELCPQDLSDAEPTFTHMSLTELFKVGKVKHIVSQNCDGLHIRSGFPRHAISEVHGNMFIECCYSCVPHKEFVRLFDVTERTGVHRHGTARCCTSCGCSLQDTIVHFGEKGKLKSPYRWKEAVRAAKRADLILCLGSSLKVLRKYSCLWSLDKKPQLRPKLVIINLQWTPKDDVATLKINGKCDAVMMNMMTLLDYEVPEYRRELDPIFQLCTPLKASERKTTTKKILIPPTREASKSGKRCKNKAISNSTPVNRNLRLKSSGEKDIDIKCHVNLFSNSSLSLGPTHMTCSSLHTSKTYVDHLIEEHTITFDQEKSNKGGVTGAAKVYPGNIGVVKLQHQIASSEIAVLNISPTGSSENIPHFRIHCNHNKELDKLDIHSQIVTCIVPQRRYVAQKHCSQGYNIQEDVNNEKMINCSRQGQFEKCVDINHFSENYDRSIPALHVTKFSEQRKRLDCQNENISELVVVNLGKYDCICEGVGKVDCNCEREQKKLGDMSMSNSKQIPNCEGGLNSNSLIVDNEISHLLEAKPAITKQKANDFEKSSPSERLRNLPHKLNNISNSCSTDYINYSYDESFRINRTSKKRLVNIKEEMVNMSGGMLLLCAVPMFQLATKNLERSREYKTISPLNQNEANLFTNHRLRSNNDVPLPHFQPVLGRLKDIILDHCYTLTGMSHYQQIKEALGISDASEKNSHLIVACDNINKCTECSLNRWSVTDQISHSINSYSSCMQMQNGDCLSFNSVLQDRKSLDSTNSLQLKSSMSMCTGNQSPVDSVIELNPHIQENTDLPSNFDDQRQENNIFAFRDVPSCILNMDDMEFVCTHIDTQSELSLDCSDHEVRDGSVMEPPTIMFPLNCEMLILPPERADSESCQEREQSTHESQFLSAACNLEVELAHPVNTVPDCHKINVSFISNTIDFHDLYVDSEVPDIVVLEPNHKSLIGSGVQFLDAFRNKSSHVRSKEQSCPEIRRVPRDLNQMCDRASSYQLRNTFLDIQQNMEAKEEKADCTNVKRENVCKEKYKRKGALAAVPGWFGKGLLVKKKRKL